MSRFERRSRTIQLNESLIVESTNTSLIEGSERLNRSVIDYARSQSPPNRRLRDASPSQCHICGKARQAECKVCGFNVCKAHLVTDASNRKVCESCYRKQVLNAKGAALAGEEKEIEDVQINILQHEDQLEQRLDENRDVDTKVARLKEALRLKQDEVNEERRKLEERLTRERDRNTKGKSQVNNLRLALEDAKRSEQLSTQRKSEADGQTIVQTNELNLLKSQSIEQTARLGALTAESKNVVHCRQFLLMGCRDCKRRFTSKFRAEILQANLSFDSFSFSSTKSSAVIPRASVAETEQESCKCELM